MSITLFSEKLESGINHNPVTTLIIYIIELLHKVVVVVLLFWPDVFVILVLLWPDVHSFAVA